MRSSRPFVRPGRIRPGLPLWLAIEKAARTRGKDGAGSVDAAIGAIQYCATDQTEKLLLDANDHARLGSFYASAALGITGLNVRNADPLGASPERRAAPLAARARRALETAKDKEFTGNAAATLFTDGASLWADGKLDWGYASFGKPLLLRARRQNPEDLLLLTHDTNVPPPGRRPPQVIRMTRDVKDLVHRVAPRYPSEAKSQGIQGKVQILALIGTDGKVLGLRLVSGHHALVDAAMTAVSQWRYKPVLANGQPCIVVAPIEVGFSLSY